ncbi:MAG: hypothetical protein EA379_07815 [Phycisphaerales bacterium]|nr:MAG: hypothetical protein EA379_07815 [Phycisphaerales bacterium]
MLDPTPPEGGGGVGEPQGDEAGGSQGGKHSAPGTDWRARAQRAEAAAAELAERLAGVREELGAASASLASCERGRAVDAALLGAGAIDLETARVLVERALDAGGGDGAAADVGDAVASLRAGKPFLFASAPGASVAGAMGAHVRGDEASAGLEDAAAAALRTGDRAALLRYLRAKRGV